MSGLRRFWLRSTAAGVALLIGASLVIATERKRAESGLDEVLSAYLSDEILHNAHDWGRGRGILVVVQREAQQPGMLKLRWLPFFDGRLKFPESSLLTRSSFLINNVFPADLHVSLHLPSGVSSVTADRYELERAAASDEFGSRLPNNLGYIAVSLPGLNAAKTEAIFYVDHFCGLCGGGEYVLMRKINGIWRVVDEHGTWVS